MADRFEQLLGIVTQEEKTYLSVLHNACVANLKTYNEERTESALRNWKSAETEKASRVEALWGRYHQEAPAFKDVSAAWEYLVGQGYEVGKSSVYKAVKDGLLKKEADGRVLEIAVRAYAAGLKKKDVVDPGEATGEKLREEIKNLKLKNQRQQFEFDRDKGKYIPRDDLMLEIISRVQVFEAQFDHFAMTKAQELVALCNGDSSQAPAVQAFLRAEKDRLITAMADTERFQVIMVADEERDRGSGFGDQEGEE